MAQDYLAHNGKTWENITPAWVQPTGVHDTYDQGDRVSFEGQNYESTISGNAWSPTAYPAGWTLVQ